MKNLSSLARALLSIAVAIFGSVVASGLYLLGHSIAAIASQAIAVICLGLAMFLIPGPVA